MYLCKQQDVNIPDRKFFGEDDLGKVNHFL